MAIWLLSVCCCWRLYLWRSQEWAPRQAGFVYLEFSWAELPLLQAFPFPSIHWGRWHCTTFLRPACYLQLTWEVGLSPLLWSFPPTATFTSFPTSGCWACAASPAFSSWLVVRDFPSPPPFLALRAPRPLYSVSFLLLLLIFSFLFFFSVGGQSVQGAMWSGPGLSVGVPSAA
jgi:hypothetical protein